MLRDLTGLAGDVQGARAGAWLLAALLALVLSAWGSELAGPLGGVLAPALFFLVRHWFPQR